MPSSLLQLANNIMPSLEDLFERIVKLESKSKHLEKKIDELDETTKDVVIVRKRIDKLFYAVIIVFGIDIVLQLIITLYTIRIESLVD